MELELESPESAYQSGGTTFDLRKSALESTMTAMNSELSILKARLKVRMETLLKYASDGDPHGLAPNATVEITAIRSKVEILESFTSMAATLSKREVA